MDPHISVIVPALNEEGSIGRCIISAFNCASSSCEVIVADGGSQDATARRAAQAGARVVPSPRGRGRQMNAGAAQAKGDILLFLHADSQLPQRYDELLDAALQHYQQRHRRPAQWGAFESIAVDGPQLTAWLLRHAVALRTRLRHLPYGDQAIFVRRTTFNDKVGGYWEQPLLEDVDLVQRLRRSCGPPALLSRPLATSGRRWQQLGLLRTTLVNQAILLGWRLGVPVPMLAACYRQGMRQPRKS